MTSTKILTVVTLALAGLFVIANYFMQLPADAPLKVHLTVENPASPPTQELQGRE